MFFYQVDLPRLPSRLKRNKTIIITEDFNMAFKGVLRPGLIQFRVLDMDAAINHYTNILGLDLVGKDDDGRVYLKGWDEFDHHSVASRPAETAGLDYVAFKVDSNEYLKSIEPRLLSGAWLLIMYPLANSQESVLVSGSPYPQDTA